MEVAPILQRTHDMHRHKRFRHGPHFRRGRGKNLSGLIWLVGLAILFTTGDWWPGILILVGISIVFRSLFRDEQPPERPAPPPFDPPPFAPPPPPAPRPAPPPADPVHRADLLPATCPNCGGPVRSNDLKWTSSHSVACSYCGANIETRKE
ncbi:MAG: hypothetical protein IPP55_16645 [Anaerolineales bacterium]|nr:hypothetical protein [Anaerolineales bacterium]